MKKTPQSKVKKSKEDEIKAQQSKENVGSVCDESDFACCADEQDIFILFSSLIKEPNAKDKTDLCALLETHGKRTLLMAISETARKGGKSVAYIREILSDTAAHSAVSAGNTATPPPKAPSPSRGSQMYNVDEWGIFIPPNSKYRELYEEDYENMLRLSARD